MTNSHHARIRGLVTTLSIVVFTCCTAAHAQLPGKVDLVELHAAQVMGAPVFAGDTKIGMVSDISTREDGRIDKIRVRTASSLGFGERIVEIPESAFTILRDGVVLDLTAGEVDDFPSAPIEEHRDRLEDWD